MARRKRNPDATMSKLKAKRTQEQDSVDVHSSLPSFDPRVPYDDINMGELIGPMEKFFKGINMAASSIFSLENQNSDSGNIMDCVRDLLSTTIVKMEEQSKCLICDECGQEFTSRAVHRMHKRIHADGYQFVCKICNKRFAYRFQFTEHIIEHEEKDRLFKCNMCPNSFQTSALLKRHKQANHKRKKPRLLRCEFCRKRFSLNKFLNKHLKEFCKNYRYLTSLLNTSENRNDSYVENEERDKDKDGFEYKSLDTLLKEIEQSGQDMKTVRSFLEMDNVRKRQGRGSHCRLCKKKKCYWKDEETKGKVFRCCVCSDLYSSLQTLQYHKLIHLGPQFVCSICNKEFYMKGKYERHMFIHTGQKPFECSVCARKFNSKYNLNTHMTTHENVKKYDCNLCQRKFISISSLQKHQHVVHNPLVGPITCNLCQKKFNTKIGFNKHLRKEHNVNEEFRCDRCCKAFVTSQSLIDHITTQCVAKHAPEFKCPQCNENHTNYKTMLRHMNKQHSHSGQTTTTCSYCFRKYNIRPLYSLHMYKAHGELACFYCNTLVVKSLVKFKSHVKHAHPLKCQSQEFQHFLEALKHQVSDSESGEDAEKPPLVIDELSDAIVDQVAMYYCNCCTEWFDSMEKFNYHNCGNYDTMRNYYAKYM